MFRATKCQEGFLARMKGIKEDEAQKTEFVFIPFIPFILAKFSFLFTPDVPARSHDSWK